METKNFFSKNKAYIFVGFGFVLLTYWYFWLATIADINYVYQFILQMMQGNFTGQLVPFDSLTHYAQMEVGTFGPNYDTIAPEVIRAFNERQEFIPFVFLAEFVFFLLMYMFSGGRKTADIKNPSDTVQVYSLFQRFVLLVNIIALVYLFVTGFSITFGNWTTGGLIARDMRKTHEIMGLFWIPIWAIMTIIAFKGHILFNRPSSTFFSKIFLLGSYKPMDRINYLSFVAFGIVLIVSGFTLWYIFPDPKMNAQVIQIKRFLLFMHFMGSATISFFLAETIYSALVSVKGYLLGIFTGKLPREYLEQLRPDVLKELQK